MTVSVVKATFYLRRLWANYHFPGGVEKEFCTDGVKGRLSLSGIQAVIMVILVNY